jgi:hypothetical protein
MIGAEDFVRVTAQITHDGIDLRDTDLHARLR